MGPKLYTMYTKPLGDIIRKHKLGYHFYADDIQLYLAFNSTDGSQLCMSRLEASLVDVQNWMNLSELKLNSDKTELMIFAPKHKAHLVRDITMTIDGTSISAGSSVRNLGVILDTTLSMEQQVTAVCKSAYYQLRQISQIRRYLTTDATKMLVNSLVTSRLDYCNSLLNGISGKLVDKLQKVQNCAARIISKTSRCEHITPVLKDLHWLPVEARLKYKVLLQTHRALHGRAPEYLSDMLTRYHPSRTLRSESATTLVVPRCRTVTYGDRCFPRSAATLWNALPGHLQDTNNMNTFKSQLKTYLFRLTFY